MMNYIGTYLVNYLVTLTIFDILKNQSQNIPSSATIPSMGLKAIFRGSSANGGFFIAIIMIQTCIQKKINPAKKKIAAIKFYIYFLHIALN